MVVVSVRVGGGVSSGVIVMAGVAVAVPTVSLGRSLLHYTRYYWAVGD